MHLSKRLIAAGATLLFVFCLAAPPALAESAPAPIDTGLQKTAATAYGKSATTLQTDPSVIVGAIVRTALSLVGLIFMALIVYGGILWMTARGAEQQVEKAKTLITSAVIGMIIIAAGYAITGFVINLMMGVTTGITQ
jgi:hypothetical protein